MGKLELSVYFRRARIPILSISYRPCPLANGGTCNVKIIGSPLTMSYTLM